MTKRCEILLLKEKLADLTAGKLKKKKLLRNNEYYDIQSEFDKLYNLSQGNARFTKLMELISSKDNILLAYRNIKKNKGSTTSGTDKCDINYYKSWNEDEFIKYFQDKFNNYNPKSVKRVEIPKPNGKTRPLGIPCIDDRIIQQCIKQVLEPICEAKFYKHSYGFRPNRAGKDAIARCMHLINHNQLHYVVDMDIKGFFDNVNHGKLLKQLWNLGIQDKNLICIVSKILKSEIEGIGRAKKGTPQGGIISPLLANVTLNELDWWISSQWESLKTTLTYSNNGNQYRAIKRTNLKEMWIVRYADDFKIFCKDYHTAQKIFIAVKGWLKERLGLEISSDKSKVTNLRKNYTEFLGLKLKAKPKKRKYVCQSHMSDKAIKTTIENYKKQIRTIQERPVIAEVNKMNAMILGSHNYYNCATNCNLDFGHINFLVYKSLKSRLKNLISNKSIKSKTYEKLYGSYNGKTRSIYNITLFPIYGCKTKPPMCFNQEICNYTANGRKLIHEALKGYNYIIQYLLKDFDYTKSVEFNDNRISRLSGQLGKCFVTQEILVIGKMECHHKIPISLGGNDTYENLIWVTEEVHKLIHATLTETINKYQRLINLDDKGLKKINQLRILAGNLSV